MAQDPIRACLAKAREDFSETSQISAEARRAVASFAKKQYIFDFIAELYDSPGSSGFLRALSGLFPDSERVWWLMALHTLRPPLSDPMHWQPTLADHRFLKILLEEIESLEIPEEDFVALNHYPLVRIVDDVLMSSAFAGCGTETVELWRTPEFYEHLLNTDFPSPTARGLSPMRRAEALTARILRILENHGVSRLRLGIGAATLYYGIRDEALREARGNFVEYLTEKDIAPCLLNAARAGLFQPVLGALVPHFERVEQMDGSPDVINGTLGPFDRAIFWRVMRTADDPQPGDRPVEEFIRSFQRWHHHGAHSGHADTRATGSVK